MAAPFPSWHRPRVGAWRSQGRELGLPWSLQTLPVLLPSSSIRDSLNIKHGPKPVQSWFGVSTDENGNIQHILSVGGHPKSASAGGESVQGHAQGRLGTPSTGNAMLTEGLALQEQLDNALRPRVALWGCPVQGSELDLVILVGPFQPGSFHRCPELG